jgi:hypothetical protein
MVLVSLQSLEDRASRLASFRVFWAKLIPCIADKEADVRGQHTFDLHGNYSLVPVWLQVYRHTASWCRVVLH